MNILVVGRNRILTERTAQAGFPVAVRIGRDTWDTERGERVHVVIYGQELTGRQYDRIYCCQQDKATEAELAYLMPRLRVGGRFERIGK